MFVKWKKRGEKKWRARGGKGKRGKGEKMESAKEEKNSFLRHYSLSEFCHRKFIHPPFSASLVWVAGAGADGGGNGRVRMNGGRGGEWVGTRGNKTAGNPLLLLLLLFLLLLSHFYSFFRNLFPSFYSNL